MNLKAGEISNMSKIAIELFGSIGIGAIVYGVSSNIKSRRS